ncbi:MAG: MerC domain-containing protein, partial [Paraglaciecola sp.]|nr:MerC domain-containing protein [Paraglaciecola sp.]
SAVVFGSFQHRSWFVVLVTSIGLGILVLVTIFGHAVLGEQGEVLASVMGSILVAFGHIKNIKARKKLSQLSPASIKITT